MSDTIFDPIKYKNEYAREHYDKVLLSLPKGSKNLIKNRAKETGKSVSQYVLDLVKKDGC